jgi:hypothetical protein
MAGAAIFNTVFSRAPATGRALLDEYQSSFYRSCGSGSWWVQSRR